MSELAAAPKRLLSRLADERVLFVVVNVATNLLFLGRSYVTMRVLNYAELGLAALMQSIILLVGALQFGFLNGGYRLLCDGDAQLRARINDIVYTALAAIALISFAVAVAAVPFSENTRFGIILVVGAAAGGATLVRSWMMNQLIAMARLRTLNHISLVAAAVSLGMLGLVPVSPLLACLASVAAQPVAFVLWVWRCCPDLHPHAFRFERALVHRIVLSGFVVFLTGIFLQLNTQIERWYVVATLGVAGLGHLYLAILFITLFGLVPTSFDAIFLPKLVRARSDQAHANLATGLRLFFLVQLGYCIAGAIAVLVFAGPVLEFVLPRYVPDLRYVYLVLPGLIAFTLAAPFAIVFNVLISYRTYLVAYGAGTAGTAAIFGASVVAGRHLGLDGVTLVRSGAYLLMAFILICGYALAARAHPEFRIPLARRGAGQS